MQPDRDVRIGKDLVAASAMPLVLAILDEGESYGYAILKRIDELSGGEMEWTDGMLYPLLHRLDRLGYVEARWDSPEGGRRRRYYQITEGGRDALAEQRRQWEVVSEALHNAWRALQAEPLPRLSPEPTSP
ncbi:MAG TPA: PadR family transcriptional regulator [Tepidiformaceae bacterium]|nr:PadR family transcriptional regulator [Tepidiformaceae bacterium]